MAALDELTAEYAQARQATRSSVPSWTACCPATRAGRRC